MTFLVDTNVLVYRYDARDPVKQERAKALIRGGLANREVHLCHQVLVEFVAATTRPITPNGPGLLTREEALREVEDLLVQFPVLCPDESLVRLAVRGAALYGLSWFDAHIWAYAERYGLRTLYSEDFQSDRQYGTVRVVDPFAED